MKIEEWGTEGSSATDHCNDLLRVIYHLESRARHGVAVGIVGQALVEGLAHDLKNPLAVVHSCCQFLAEDKKLNRQGKENVQWMRENINKANELISQFLAFARVGLTFQPININECIRKEWEITLLRNGNQNVLFHCQLAEDLPEVFGDYEKIEQIFLDLFRNAVEAVAEVSQEGRVTVQTLSLSSGKIVEVSILDNGPGIPEKIRKKLFRPFCTTKKTGKGLSLYLAKHFVQQHQGEIAIENLSGGGTKVTLRLPAFLNP